MVKRNDCDITDEHNHSLFLYSYEIYKKNITVLMRILTPAHKYEVDNFGEGNGSQVIEFTRKEAGYHIPGTTNEEIINMLIDRLLTLHSKQPCDENRIAIELLKLSKSYVIKRKDRVQRHKRLKDGSQEEDRPSELTDNAE